ncbi:transglycosylase SLT domain-containing protein [Pseudohongiella spirulinae]|uniref:Lytic murein transglycosylase, putative, lmt23A n=1 Tax=Pseudohongiella spirulinae TaxID=1249552 RepID=A0A0S2K9E8_9GAMM|nr:transglycosylase SLT domain-containing protein [Pseudohongiella spirulinae]ALO44971.1 Lytic murein transglycosylase, putative, lmt23A [Pseudohongiella spirulinae]
MPSLCRYLADHLRQPLLVATAFAMLQLAPLTYLHAQAPHYGTNISAQRELYLQAREALERGQQQQFQTLRGQLIAYPLLQYLDYASIQRQLADLPYADVDRFLESYSGSYLAERLEREWVATLAKEERWQDVAVYFNPDNTYTTLSCQAHQAWLNIGDTERLTEVTTLWNVTRSQPNECDPVFEAWMAAGHLSADIAWQRFSNNLQAGNRSLARYIAGLLPEREQQLAQLYLQTDSQPERLRNLDNYVTNEPEVPDIVLHGVRRLANIDAPQAMLMLHAHNDRHNFSDQQMLDAQRYIAMRLLLQGFDEETETLLRNTPELATETLVSWLLRDALRDLDWPRLQQLLQKLPEQDRQSERWQYWHARSLEQARGEQAAERALAIYRSIAGNRSFYGFSAAQRLNQPYAIVDRPVDVNAADLDALYNLPAVVRAHELYHLGDELNARNEWQHANRNMTPGQIAASGRLANNWGWHRQSIQAMIRLQYWDDLSLRFPLAHGDLFSSAASQLDVPAPLLYAVTRQESAFMHDVRSPAGARGLMQLMPATAREVAQGLGLRISNQDLYNPDINVTLGSHYLASLLEEFDGNRILATAAYNAGPNRINQWLLRSRDKPLPVDVWIETIPFAETRGYVQNVLVYAVIYGHLSGQAVPFMTDRERTALL